MKVCHFGRVLAAGASFILLSVASTAWAQNVALLLFDGETGSEFVGCLNCSRIDSSAVCNRYGDFGSRYSDQSIWNRYGKFGSRYEANSPWNRYGEGLRIVDSDGNFYGVFKIGVGAAPLPIVSALKEAHEFFEGELDDIRTWYCDPN